MSDTPEDKPKKAPPRLLSKTTGTSGDLRDVALKAHSKIQDVWGKKKSAGANNILIRLKPEEVQAYALDFTLRKFWEYQRNGEELHQCVVPSAVAKELRQLVLSILEEYVPQFTKNYVFEIPDPEIVAKRDLEKRQKAIEDSKARLERQKQSDEAKLVRIQKFDSGGGGNDQHTNDSSVTRDSSIPNELIINLNSASNKEKIIADKYQSAPLNLQSIISKNDRITSPTTPSSSSSERKKSQKSQENGEKEKRRKRKEKEKEKEGGSAEKTDKDSSRTSKKREKKKNVDETSSTTVTAEGESVKKEKKEKKEKKSSEKKTEKKSEKKSEGKEKKPSDKKEKKEKKEKKKEKKERKGSTSTANGGTTDKSTPPNEEEVKSEVKTPTPVNPAIKILQGGAGGGNRMLKPPSSMMAQSNPPAPTITEDGQAATLSRVDIGRNRRRREGTSGPRMPVEEVPIPNIVINHDLVNLELLNQVLIERIQTFFQTKERKFTSDNQFLDFYHLSVKGPRPSNEDEYAVIENINEWMGLPEDTQDRYSYVAVYDGHSGKFASLYTRSQLHSNMCSHPSFFSNINKSIEDSFNLTDARVNEIQQRDNFSCGSTALSIWIKNNKQLIVGNVGDCRGFVSRGGEAYEVAKTHNLSREDEVERIKSLGGAVVWFGTWRVNGILAVSRSIGDYNLKSLVTSMPDITYIDITPVDEFLVLASDGLWDGMSGEEMVQVVKETVESKGRNHVCKALCDIAIDRDTKDNVTVVAVFFNHSSSGEITVS